MKKTFICNNPVRGCPHERKNDEVMVDGETFEKKQLPKRPKNVPAPRGKTPDNHKPVA